MPDRSMPESLESRPERLDEPDHDHSGLGSTEFTSVIQELRRLDDNSLSRLEYRKDQWDGGDSNRLLQAFWETTKGSTPMERAQVARDLSEYTGLEPRRNTIRMAQESYGNSGPDSGLPSLGARAEQQAIQEMLQIISQDQKDRIQTLQGQMHHALLNQDPEPIGEAIREMHRSDHHLRPGLDHRDPRELDLHHPGNQERIQELQEDRLETLWERFHENFLGDPQDSQTVQKAIEGYLRTLCPQDALELARHIAGKAGQ